MSSASRRAFAEFLGTFIFVLIGAGSAVSSSYIGLDKSTSLLVAALANGIGLAIAVSATMNISGGHMNPAVSTGLIFAGKFRARELVQYVVAQLLGSIVASVFVLYSFPSQYTASTELGSPQLSVSVAQGILVEAVLTFVLVTSVLLTAVDERAPKIAGFGIGLAVFCDVLFGGALTGAAMNPARAYGPMIVSGFIPSYWYVYLVGPLLGGIIAGLVYRYLVR